MSITNFVKKELEKGTFPGAVLAITNEKEILYCENFGQAQIIPEATPIFKDSLFDLASLTKAVATTTSIIKLVEEGEISLWDDIKKFFPWTPEEKKNILIYHLLTHTSGFQPIIKLWKESGNIEDKIKIILNSSLKKNAGTEVIYSDLNFILLGEIVKKVSGEALDKFAMNIFKTMGMEKTVFNPKEVLPDINEKYYVATEFCNWRNRIMVGEVHDENAYSVGGVSGHAGLFSTAKDLCIFVQMLLNKGRYKEKRILSRRSIEVMLQNWTKDKGVNRGLGWELYGNLQSSGGILLSESSFGHTGFTGTSIWVDRKRMLGIILLSNRIHPGRKNDKIFSFRPRLHNYIAANFDN
jgi:serine-type D-Ala-D-Ala carboxypeptidase